MRRLLTGLALFALAAPAVRALEIDPPGRPNEDCYVIREKIESREWPIEKRFDYFGHYNPAIRRMAAFSLMREGEKAMPFILKALQATDVRVIRSGCDALTGPFGIAPRQRKELRAVMTPDVAAKAVPYLARLLEHEDMYVREGAMLALSNCGKAAAPLLDKVVPFLDDDEWWLRNAAAHVLRGVGPPEADRYAEKLARVFRTEPSTYPRNRMREAAVRLAEGAQRDAVIRLVAQDAERRERGYHRTSLLELFKALGPKASAALPTIEKLMTREKALLGREKNEKTRAAIEREVAYLERLRARVAPPPPKRPST